MSKITELTAALAQPAVEKQGCSLWDVEYVKEAGSRYLRLYIDRPDGVSIDDCEAISREVSDLLDETDPIPESYIFEVSSAGADRQLKKPAHFAAFEGAEIDIGFYHAVNGQKNLTGILTGYDNGDVSLNVGGESITIPKKEIAFVRLHVSF